MAMAEENHYTDIDISDVIDNSEQFETEIDHTEGAETDANVFQESDLLNSEEQIEKRPQIQNNKTEIIRTTRLPMARIKNIMKMDPDVNVISGDAVFLVTKATELFLETMAKETYTYVAANKKKIINKKDLDNVIDKVDCLCFLEGAMDF